MSLLKHYKSLNLMVSIFLISTFCMMSCKPSESCHPALTEMEGSQFEKFELSRALLHFPEVSLISMNEEETSFENLLNSQKPIFLQFIFTSCPTICPVLSSHLAVFQEQASVLGEGVKIVSISIDPEYDTPRRLKEYANKFGAGPVWNFYTGNKKEIDKLQASFRNFQGNKMYHRPATYYRDAASDTWYVYEGFVSGQELWEDFRNQSLTTVF